MTTLGTEPSGCQLTYDADLATLPNGSLKTVTVLTLGTCKRIQRGEDIRPCCSRVRHHHTFGKPGFVDIIIRPMAAYLCTVIGRDSCKVLLVDIHNFVLLDKPLDSSTQVCNSADVILVLLHLLPVPAPYPPSSENPFNAGASRVRSSHGIVRQASRTHRHE